MIKTKSRMTLCITLIVLNLAFIWGNSMMSREISSAISDLVGRIISWFIPSSQVQGGAPGHGTLRKLAHFMEFCSLGMLLSWLFYMVSDKRWHRFFYPSVIGAAVACMDETIQIFAVNRGPGIRDVLIDTAGVLLGVLILFVIAICKRKPLPEQ